MAAEVRIIVSGEGNAKQVLEDTRKGVQGIGQEAEKQSGSARGFFSGVLQTAGGILTSNIIGAVAGQISGMFSGGIADAREAARLMAATEQTIASMGNAAGVSAQHVVDMASALSDASGKSLFGDDQIQQASNLLLTFGEIKGATFDAATALTVDLAQALGGAPKDQAMMLGKALNDPIHGMTALGKAGLTFSEDQKAAIKAMQESGDMAGAQAVIIAELNKQVGGQAAAAAAATGGWSEFQGRLGEVAEGVGGVLLPILNGAVGLLNDSFLPAVESVAGAFGDLVNFFSGAGDLGSVFDSLSNIFSADIAAAIAEMAGALADAGPASSEFAESIGFLATQLGLPGELIQDIVIAVQNVIGAFSGGADSASGFGSVINDLAGIWAALQPVIMNVVTAIWNVVSAMFGQVQTFIRAHGTEISAFMREAWTQIMEIIKLAIQLYNAIVPPILHAIAGFIRDHGEQIQGALSGAWNVIKGVIEIALALIKGIIQTALALIKGDWQGAWDAIKTMSENVVKGIVDVLEGAVGLFGSAAQAGLDAILGVWRGFTDWAGIGGGIIDGIVSGVIGAAHKLVDAAVQAAADAIKAVKDWLGIDSPSRVFRDEVGEPLILGIIDGIRNMIPQLMDQFGAMGGDLIDKAKRVGEDAAAALSSGLTAEASIDRLKARAVDDLLKIGTVDARVRHTAEVQLQEAEQTAAGMADPEQAAKFFRMRRDQIFEIAELQERASKAADDETRRRIQGQIDLTLAAQAAEQEAFEVNASAKQTAADKLAESILQLSKNEAFITPEEELPPGFGAAFEPLFALMHMLQSGPAAGAPTFNIDARGSTMTRDEFERVIWQTLQQSGRMIDDRNRIGG